MPAEGKYRWGWKPLACCAVELLFYLPFLLILSAWIMPPEAVYVWLPTLLLPYAVAAWLMGLISRIRLWLRLIVSVAIGALHMAGFVALSGVEANEFLLPICALGGIWMAERGFALRLNGWSRSFSNTHMVNLLLGYLVYMFIGVFFRDLFQPYSALAAVCGMIAVAVLLVLGNERHLREEIIDKGKSSAVRSAKRRNRFMMAMLIGVAALLSAFRQIQHWVETWLKKALAALFGLFGSEQAPPAAETPEPEAPPPGMFPPAEAKEPAAWLKLLETVLLFIVYGLIIAVLAVVLFLLFRKVFRSVGPLLDKLLKRKGVMEEENGEYQDEIESLMSLTKSRKNKAAALKKRSRNSASAWAGLTNNGEKIRYLYRVMIERGIMNGYRYRKDLTARESASEVAAHVSKNDGVDSGQLDRFMQLYDQARYGKIEPDSGDVERYRKWVEGKEQGS